MKYDRDEIRIKNAFDTIQTPEYDIFSAVGKKMEKSPVVYKKALTALIAGCLCMAFAIGVAAATIPSFHKLLSMIGPDMASILQPLEISSEDNGIKMEAVAAMNDDETAVFYLTLQDLTGDRIDKTLYLRPGDYSFTDTINYGWEIVNYDPTTKTATLRMLASGMAGLNGKKVTFSLGPFIGKRQSDTVNTGISLANIPRVSASETVNCHIKGLEGGDYEEFIEDGAIKILRPDQMNLSLPNINFVHISNVGFIDGRLHIQIERSDHGLDGEEYLYLADSQGNPLHNLKDYTYGEIIFGTDESGDPVQGSKYKEYIFDIKNLNLNKTVLAGDFVTNENYITGNWKTTFKIQSVKAIKTSECNIKLDTWTINKISLSPMGIVLKGVNSSNEQKTLPLTPITILVNMTDGSTETYKSLTGYDNSTGLVEVNFTPSLPLEVSKVKSITINGTTIDF